MLNRFPELFIFCKNKMLSKISTGASTSNSASRTGANTERITFVLKRIKFILNILSLQSNAKAVTAMKTYA